MASFYPNPDQDNESWIEGPADGLGFRIWHVMFFCFSALLITAILICCCIKIRIPRTKQEIEADYQRKKLARKFREKLKCIENQSVNGMDLKRALELIQQEIENECKSKEDTDTLHDKSNTESSETGKISPSKTLAGAIAVIISSKKMQRKSQSYV